MVVGNGTHLLSRIGLSAKGGLELSVGFDEVLLRFLELL